MLHFPGRQSKENPFETLRSFSIWTLWGLKVLSLPLHYSVAGRSKTFLEAGLVEVADSGVQAISNLEFINLQWSALFCVNYQKGWDFPGITVPVWVQAKIFFYFSFSFFFFADKPTEKMICISDRGVLGWRRKEEVWVGVWWENWVQVDMIVPVSDTEPWEKMNFRK